MTMKRTLIRCSLARPRGRFEQALVALGLCVAFAVSGCELDGEGTDTRSEEKLPATPLSSGADVDASGVTSGAPGSDGAGGGHQPGHPAQPGLPAPPGNPPQQPGASGDGGASVPQTPGDSGSAVVGTPKRDAGPVTSVPDAGASGRRCGTRGGVSCGAEQFCNFEPDVDCGGTDRGGVCETRPQVCTDQYDPVCGCDNRTYSNSCEAHAAGVSIKRDDACTQAECKAAGGSVKASKGADIPKCGAGDEQWSLGGGIEPIICCRKKAEPPKPGAGAGKMCGGLAGIACDGANFCNYEEKAGGQGCDGIADGAGVCEPTPMGCTRDYKPVCGCDRRTYSNACTAHAAGVSVLRSGLCTDVDCKAIGGQPVDGIGPAPVCPTGTVDLGSIRYEGGQIAIEGTICCGSR